MNESDAWARRDRTGGSFAPPGFYVAAAAALGWMALIFVKSAQSYSEQSLLPLFAQWFSQEQLMRWLPHLEFNYDGGLVSFRDPYGFLEFFVRKGGHVTEFTILTLLWAVALLLKPLSARWALPAAGLIALAYAASDEWHQTFVPERTGHAIDVAVDALGVLLALLLVAVVRGTVRRRRRKQR
ncbi:VanZ family protein [Paenibacillus athensensis]|uniref:VanZ-like domain-containing protein n=1 Tax=Paenibacillus athensensis TaxID=1967502 RepID=A0A4Y8Q9C9_9BACL|nr:VanZ family protein [Paenibacillus athensensis]MCD1258987.1 VanZ family protein [Paenibacillus athensensis]